MSIEVTFTKENLDFYLKELAKEYRKRGRGIRAELILIGGASVLINYDFREMTYDIDAVYTAPSLMKEAINAVGDRLGLPNGWLNADFIRTDSYTPRLAQYSTYYRTYSNILEIRTVNAEYLVAMKLVSGRRYKKDLSDVVGILYEQDRAGNPLSYEQINKAIMDLYGSWEYINEHTKDLLLKALETPDLKAMYLEQCEEESEAKAAILEIEHKYPKIIREDNVNDILQAALAKKRKARERGGR